MNIFVLTGAGISAESGLGTFRDKVGTGIWAKFDPMKLATPEAFAADPDKVLDFYNMRRRNLLQAEPNPAHFALARLEVALAQRGDRLFLCTQNIDDLLMARCNRCEAVTEWRDDLGSEDACPSCGRLGGMRPHVVWFGEMPLDMDVIEAGLIGADLFVSIGTSGSVYPAAGFVAEARAAGIRTCEINLERSDNARVFDERRYGPASEAVPAWVESVLNSA